MIWLAPASTGSLLQPAWIMRRTGASDSAGCCRAVVAFTGFRSCDMPSLWAATSVNPAVTADSQQQQVVRICSCSSRRRESAHVCFCCGLPRRPPLPPWPGYSAHCCRSKMMLLSSWCCQALFFLQCQSIRPGVLLPTYLPYGSGVKPPRPLEAYSRARYPG